MHSPHWKYFTVPIYITLGDYISRSSKKLKNLLFSPIVSPRLYLGDFHAADLESYTLRRQARLYNSESQPRATSKNRCHWEAPFFIKNKLLDGFLEDIWEMFGFGEPSVSIVHSVIVWLL